MRYLRSLPTTRLLLLVAAALGVALAGGAMARAALSGGGTPPPPSALDSAIKQALDAPKPDGVTARVSFTNRLFSGASLPGTSSPAITGAAGRLWLANDGRMRLELQSNAGDLQVQTDGKTLQAYDASSNTVYRLDLSALHGAAGSAPAPQTGSTHATPTLAEIDSFLANVGKHMTLSGATAGTTAGQPSYTVRVSPKHDGGLLGGAELAWDANHGVPLRVAVYAQGDASPVLELTATDISYGPVSASDLWVDAPAGAKVVDLTPPARPSSSTPDTTTHAKPVEGVQAVSAAVGFPLAAPDTVVGLPRKTVRLIDWKGSKGALVVYGQGLGAIVALEQPTGSAGKGAGPLGSLPKVSINGSSAAELSTPLGTVLRVDHAGVTTTVIGSVPAVAAEAAARDLTK